MMRPLVSHTGSDTVTVSRYDVKFMCMVVCSFLLFAGRPHAQEPTEPLGSLLLQYNTALTNKVYVDAVLACAAALRLAPANKDAQHCATTLKNPDQVHAVAQAGKTLLGVGDYDRALAWCSAVLVLNPMDTDASACATAAQTRRVTQGQEQSKLEQVRGYIAMRDSARAAALLGELLKSESPEMLTSALQLQQTVNQQTVDQDIAKQRANIRYAAFQIADSKREAAATTLKDVLATTNSPKVAEEAAALLEGAKTSWVTIFWESVQAAWIMQFIIALLMIAGLWIVLHGIRKFWRWGVTHFVRLGWRKSARWTFAGVVEDPSNIGARDPILDALQRVPTEVRNPIWTPTRLLLYPGNAGWEVWEDFAVCEKERAEALHEPTFQTFKQRPDDARMLADAFQNVDLTVGTVGLRSVTRFWAGLMEWWQAGKPSFSASARVIDSADIKAKRVEIRISASGPEAEGMLSVHASTRAEDSCDAVSLCAGLAAYKLLFRMTDEQTPAQSPTATSAQTPAQRRKDTVEQIDAHATFRHAATALAGCVRSVWDVKEELDRRNATLQEIIEDLEFAHDTFNRDENHRVYYLETLRLQAVAYALLARESAALVVLEELEDATAGSAKPPREKQIHLEALYNQALLHWQRAMATKPPPPSEFAMASTLWKRLAECGAELWHANDIWQLAQLAHLPWRDWLTVKVDETQAMLDASKTWRRALAERARKASGAERRQCTLLAQHAYRYYAIAQLRLIAAFELPARGPFTCGAAPVKLLTPHITDRVASCMDYFARSDAIGQPTFNTLVTRAYGALLQSKWHEAEQLAKQAITASEKQAITASDPADQYACYIAAEAAVQRYDEDQARQYLAKFQSVHIEDAALNTLAAHFMPVPSTGSSNGEAEVQRTSLQGSDQRNTAAL